MSRFEYPIRGQKLSITTEIGEPLCQHQSAYQVIEIFDTPSLGKILLLDGHIQLATLDEAAYHEALIHIPALSVPELKSALVLGGGDGGVLRELVKHESLERIVMIEIDKDVVECCERFLPELSDGAFKNKRVELVFADAIDFVQKTDERFDLIVADVTDTYEEEEDELSEEVFSVKFYRLASKLLTEGGIMVTQADNPLFCPYSVRDVRKAFRQLFNQEGFYWTLVPSFGGYSGFVWGSKSSTLTFAPDQEFLKKHCRFLNDQQWQLALSQLPFIDAQELA